MIPLVPGAIFGPPGFFRISLTGNNAMVERSLPAFATAIAGTLAASSRS